MQTFIRLYSNKKGEIQKFLNKFYLKKEPFENDSNNNVNLDTLEWQKNFENPVEITDIIGVFIDNSDDYKINMWVCLDEDILVNVTKNNVNELIRYIFERFPY